MRLIKCKFEWKVVNLRQIYEAVQPGIKTQLISSRFPGFHEVAWELVIEIHKIKNYEEKETVNIWLRQVGPCAIDDFNCRNPFAKNYVTNTKYKIYVIKDNNFTIISRSKNKLEDQQQIGYVQVLLDDVLSKAGAWFPNFKLLEGLQLYCEVKLVYLDSLEILQKKYASMFYNNKFTDCVFKIGDKTIKAHRCVLVQSSEVFKKMFGDTGMIEATTGEVTITDATPECFRQFLSYLYTAKIFKYTFKKYVEDLFSLAHKYQVETLQYECERYMASLLKAETFLKYCGIISFYGARTLEIACKDYCLINKETFFDSKEWKDVKDTYPELASKFTKFVDNDGIYGDDYESYKYVKCENRDGTVVNVMKMPDDRWYN